MTDFSQARWDTTRVNHTLIATTVCGHLCMTYVGISFGGNKHRKISSNQGMLNDGSYSNVHTVKATRPRTTFLYPRIASLHNLTSTSLHLLVRRHQRA